MVLVVVDVNVSKRLGRVPTPRKNRQYFYLTASVLWLLGDRKSTTFEGVQVRLRETIFRPHGATSVLLLPGFSRHPTLPPIPEIK